MDWKWTNASQLTICTIVSVVKMNSGARTAVYHTALAAGNRWPDTDVNDNGEACLFVILDKQHCRRMTWVRGMAIHLDVS